MSRKLRNIIQRVKRRFRDSPPEPVCVVIRKKAAESSGARCPRGANTRKQRSMISTLEATNREAEVDLSEYFYFIENHSASGALLPDCELFLGERWLWILGDGYCAISLNTGGKMIYPSLYELVYSI